MLSPCHAVPLKKDSDESPYGGTKCPSDPAPASLYMSLQAHDSQSVISNISNALSISKLSHEPFPPLVNSIPLGQNSYYACPFSVVQIVPPLENNS